MTIRPAEGERRAASGYRAQYLVCARVVLEALQSGDMAWVRVADPDAGRVDDLQIARTARLDAYQVKWAQYPGAMTLNDLVRGTSVQPSLIAQLVDGWRRLRTLYPHHRVVVHLVTNEIPSLYSLASMLPAAQPPVPYHLAAFIEQSWLPAQDTGSVDSDGSWSAVWKELQAAGNLSLDELPKFVRECSLDFGVARPIAEADLRAIADQLFETAASSERVVELSRENLLHRLGWTHRYAYRNKHEFPTPVFLYRPICRTAEALERALSALPSGYLGVFGPPGSGKSTLLTQTLRSLALRLVPYYAYVPEAQDPSILRGESTNFLHDVTLRLQRAGFGPGERPDPGDRPALVALLHTQLQELGKDYAETQTKTVILIDGLDHISREQHPERSLLQDLPLPEAIPPGVYMVVGSQTDELPDLPAGVRRALQHPERRIQMERLSPVDVSAIAQEAIPFLNADEQRKVFQLCGGHPLALIYLLKPLRQTQQSEDRARLLENAIPYQGDIEEQYWGHWHAIEGDEPLVHTLGLLARARGAIPTRWVAEWTDANALRKLQRLFLVYFEEEGEDRWVFFHPSFRLFLVDRTSEPLPGRSRESQNQAYHRELAGRCVNSSESWRWEALYHYFGAGETATVVQLATHEWFHQQVEALRPLDAIQTDVRLAIQAAGTCEDVAALARLTLIGASLEQRAWALENRLLPDLLVEVGEAVRAVEHLRDGNRLRVEAEQALRLSSRLADTGLRREGYRLFELAEPLELLSGRAIPDDHTRPQNLRDLLSEWVQSAVVFRGIRDVVQAVRRIRIARSWNQKISIEQASQEFQAWLLLKGALACCRRDDWAGWRALLEALDETSERLERFFTLLRAADHAQQTAEQDRAGDLFAELLSTFKQSEIKTISTSREWVEACLSVAELALAITDDRQTARVWMEDLPPIPLHQQSVISEKEASIHALRFRQARLCYLLRESRIPEALRDEAEARTIFGQHTEEEEKAASRQIALAVFYLARLWAWGLRGAQLGPEAFLQQVRWILDLFGRGWTLWPVRMRFAIARARAEVLEYVVTVASQFGSQVIDSLEKELESRWSDSEEGQAWNPELQRKLVTLLVDAGADLFWAEAQFGRIGQTMLHGLDPYGRVEECERQAEAWLAIGRRDAALREIHQMVQAAIGLQSDKDYQLVKWVSWLGRVNELEPERAEERICLMLRRVVAVKGSASGVSDAAEEILSVVFRWSPHRAIRLLKSLLEHHIIGYQGGMTRILVAALTTKEVPVREVFHAVCDLVLPIVPGTEPDLIETLVVQIFARGSRSTALDMVRSLVERIRSDVPAKHRTAWYRGIANGLLTASVPLAQVGLCISELEDQPNSQGTSSFDDSLHLTTGERIEPEQVCVRALTLDDLKTLLENEDREHARNFGWTPVIEHLASRLGTAEITELETIATSRLVGEQLSEALTALSKRLLALGERALAWELAERALKMTAPSGWASYWDGGAKHSAIRQLIVVDAEPAHKLAIQLYARDLGERFRYPAQVMPHLDQVLSLLADQVPVAETWTDIEIYLDELFTSVVVEPQPALEESLHELAGTSPDTPGYAIATLIALHLDHPSYVVAQGAVRACTALLLDNSETVIVVLHDTLSQTDEAAERTLMVLDAVSAQSVAAVRPFSEELERLGASPNFALRLIASRISSRIHGRPSVVPTVERKTPAVFSLHLPESAFHHTERTVHGEQGPIFIGDPARELSPFDMELRAVAEAVDVPEDNLFYRAVQHFRALRTRRTWLTEQGILAPERLSAFLDQTGLRLAHNKPHIAPARQALAYVVAELYDGGYLPADMLRWLSSRLIRYDPLFILERAVQRPLFLDQMGGISYEYSMMRLPAGWVEKAGDSLSLLRFETPDGRLIIGERTRLRLLEDDWPEEERISVVRAEQAGRLWNGEGVQHGHPPFARIHGAQVEDYSRAHAPLDHLVIANDPYDHETPGSSWLALNPAFGEALGWHPVPGKWFRWLNQAGDLVAESLWWSDGPLEHFSEHLHVEVGGGWLVLVTKSGFEEIKTWTTALSRGGVVRRSLGWCGSLGRNHAQGFLEFA